MSLMNSELPSYGDPQVEFNQFDINSLSEAIRKDIICCTIRYFFSIGNQYLLSYGIQVLSPISAIS